MHLFIPLFLLFPLLLTAHADCVSCQHITIKENKGQWDNHILYRADLSAAAVFFEKQQITFDLYNDQDVMDMVGGKQHSLRFSPLSGQSIRHHAYRIRFPESNEQVKITADEKTSTYYNYFLGQDKDRWKSRVAAWKKICYQNLWPHTDLLYYSTDEGHLKYDLILKPGADINKIAMKYEGISNITLKNNQLVIETAVGEIIEQKPYAYQWINGEQIEIRCRFVWSPERKTLHFQVDEPYRKDVELIIDPTLVFSTYSGSTADNFGYTATFDRLGNAFEGGSVFSPGQYPVTLGAYQQFWAGGSGGSGLAGVDMGIQKFSADGSSVLYATYLGGAFDEVPHSMIVNSNNELIILGTSGSPNFPVTTGVYDQTFNGGPATGAFGGLGISYPNGSDFVISRLSEDGTQLLASTFVGGTGNDGLNISPALRRNYADEIRGEIDIDENDDIYVASTTRSVDFPRTFNTFQNFFAGGADACVFKMDNALSTLQWGTTYGGTLDDAAYSICQDNNGAIYFTGGTASTNLFITAGSLQATNGGGPCDGFIAHMTPDGQNMLHSTYFGHNSYNQLYFVETNKANEVFVFGQANASASNYIFNAAYNVPNGGMIVSKFSPDLSSLIWSTSYGSNPGVPDISPTAFLVDVCSKVYMSGWGGAVNGFGGTSGLPVTPDAYQATTTNSDFYLIVLEDDASAISYATFFGGASGAEHVDGGTSRFDKGGVIYQSVCSSCGGSFDFPTTSGSAYPNNLNTQNGNRCSNALFKFDFNLPICLADFSVNPGCAPHNASFTNLSEVNGNSPTYSWDFGDGFTSTDSTPQHLYTAAGVYTIRLIVTDLASCNTRDTIERQVVILSDTTATLPSVVICPGESVNIGFPPAAGNGLTYLWSPAIGLSNNQIPNPIASPQNSITYLCQIANGICTDTFYQPITVLNNQSQILGPSAICPVDSVILSVQNTLLANYTYQWAPVSSVIGAANGSQILISPNQTTTYSVTVTHPVGCTYTDTFNINVLPEQPVFADFTYPSSACASVLAQFQSLINGIGPYQILWSFGDGTGSLQTNPQHLFANPGVYTVTLVVTDTGGCRTKDTAIHQILVLNDSTGTLPDIYICPGDTTPIGFSAISDPTLTFQWSPATGLNNTQIPNPLCFTSSNQTYTCLVSNGICTDTFFQQVNLFLNQLSINPADSLCPQDSLFLQVNNTANGNYLYQWSPLSAIISGANTANPLVSPDVNTTYNVTVTATPWGCIYTGNVLVPARAVIPVTADFIVPNGCKPYTAQVQNLTNSIGPASYFWTFSNGGSSTAVNPTPLFNEGGAYTITLIAIDSGGCFSKDTISRSLYVLRDTLIFLPNDTICVGDTVSIGISPYGTAALSYSWSPTATLSNAFTTPTEAWPDQNTNYHLTIANTLCADDVYQQIIVINDSIRLLSPPVLCAGDILQLQATTTGGSMLSYVWSPDQFIVQGQYSPVVQLVIPNDLLVSVTGTDPQFGCIYEASTWIDLASTLPEVTASALPAAILFGDSSQLNLNFNSSITSIQWQNDSSLTATSIPNPFAHPQRTTTYYVTVQDSFGCQKTDSVIVEVFFTPCSAGSVYVPNAFSPNGDGKNDQFLVRGNYIEKIHLMVFDRWGELVFESRNLQQGWDGRFKESALDPAVFGYVVEGTCDDGIDFRLKGNVTLLR